MKILSAGRNKTIVAYLFLLQRLATLILKRIRFFYGNDIQNWNLINLSPPPPLLDAGSGSETQIAIHVSIQ